MGLGHSPAAIRLGTAKVEVNADGSITVAPATGATLDVYINGSAQHRFSSTGPVLHASAALQWGSSGLDAPDTFLYRDAANTLAQRNGANAQAHHLYNTYTDNSNYERGGFRWSSNQLQLVTTNAGTGSIRPILIKTGGAAQLFLGVDNGAYWVITPTTRDLSPVFSGSVDLGAPSRKVRNIYVSGSLVMQTKAGAPSDTDVTNPADGMMVLDTTNHRIYFRSGGTWKFAALT